MVFLREKAYAKINLTLDVLGKRDDGYHDLKSVFQQIMFCDEVEICLGTEKPWQIVGGRDDVPADESNLAWKAAKVFFLHTGIDPNGLSIRIEKNIPSQAGLGGGSADAAAVLRALNRHYGSCLSVMQLAELGAKIGSDVPFCVLGGTAMAEGRGEILRPISPMPKCKIVLCKPDFSASTPVLFKRIDSAEIMKHPDNDAMEKALEAGDIHGISELVCNVFDEVVSCDYPQVAAVKEAMNSAGALCCQMTGSGSVIFGIMPDETAAFAAAAAVEGLGFAAYITEPV